MNRPPFSRSERWVLAGALAAIALALWLAYEALQTAGGST